MNGMLLIWSNAIDGQDVEYHDWYDNEHIPEVLALVPGVRLVGRMQPRRSLRPDVAIDDRRFVAVYEIHGDVGQVADALSAASPHFTKPFRGIDSAGTTGVFYELLDETTPPT